MRARWLSLSALVLGFGVWTFAQPAAAPVRLTLSQGTSMAAARTSTVTWPLFCLRWSSPVLGRLPAATASIISRRTARSASGARCTRSSGWSASSGERSRSLRVPAF